MNAAETVEMGAGSYIESGVRRFHRRADCIAWGRCVKVGVGVVSQMEAPCVGCAKFSQTDCRVSVRTGIDFQKEGGGNKSEPENGHLCGDGIGERVEVATPLEARGLFIPEGCSLWKDY
jgi:hypothetical protein